MFFPLAPAHSPCVHFLYIIKVINLIIELNMRIFSSFLIFTMLLVIIPGILPAVDVNYRLLAALKSGPSLMDVSPEDLLFNEPEPARGSFLVATRKLKGTFFSEAVILLLNHSDQGTSGLVINRPSHIRLSSVFPDVKEFQKNDGKIYTGGPVELTSYLILIQSDGKPPKSQPLMDNIHLTTSMKTLEYMHNQSGRDESIRVFFGYSGWKPGQLVSEVERGSWYVMNGDAGVVFDKNPDGLWKKFMQRKARGTSQ